ncbi:MAG: SDR family oxidoreductase [Actinomycetota bacterium]|nr:SDR family oxidoreductase [Actinomycetota bacterium]
MQLDGARALVCGATGVLGGQIARELVDAGATVMAAGRDSDRLAAIASTCGTAPLTFDVIDADSCKRTVDQAVTAVGGLDLLVVATGVAAFGPATEADAAVVEELFAVNALGPMSLIRAAAPHLPQGGAVAVLSAVLADLPTAGMAEYSASKSALAAWLEVLRRENRRSFRVLDIRPPHLDTGLADRALAGHPPKLPSGFPIGELVAAIIKAIRGDAREIVYDYTAKSLETR